MKKLEGKAIVITGAGRGLGQAYALAAAREGAAVMVNDVDNEPAHETVEKIAKAGGKAIAHIADISAWDAAAGLIRRCVDEFGKIDGLINNAGILVMGTIEEQDEQSLRRQLEVNLLGQAFVGLHALREMLPRKKGSVVNVNSGTQSGQAFRCAYSAAVAGVASLTYSWAAECAGTGVRVNVISPVALTRELEQTQPFFDRMQKVGRISSGFETMRKAMQALTPEMNTPLALYLLSDESAAVNGQGIRFMGEELMLMIHPAVLYPPLRRKEWTFEEIRDAFRNEWKDRMLPLGLAQLKAEVAKIFL